MIHSQPKLDDVVKGMRAVGELLVPHNFPKAAPSPSQEDDLAVFKEREAVIDGYPVVLHYQKSDYGRHFLETLQVYGKSSPFLPFALICKLAKRFLGRDYLSLVELFKDNRKIYIWSVAVDRDGQPIASPYDMETEDCLFEGLNYQYMQPSQVNFF